MEQLIAGIGFVCMGLVMLRLSAYYVDVNQKANNTFWHDLWWWVGALSTTATVTAIITVGVVIKRICM